MSQFDKDDVEELGLLKLDVLGIRMQSSMAHAVELIRGTTGVEVDLDDQQQVRFTDDDTYRMISAAKTLGVFQIESPGQRELVGKSGIDSFDDIITDISLFRPGPVKSDMITPYLESKQGWKETTYLHDDLRPILGDTQGVVVFHEQVIEIIARFARISYAEADECRRALGDVEGMAEVKRWFYPRARGLGYSERVVEGIWKILEAFASFGFCKAHAAAFALPTFQSAWLKAHWPAHFLAGVLTHDPGMYPKRLILDDARQCGITVLGLDVNASEKEYVVEWLDPEAPVAAVPPPVPVTGVPDGTAWGIRLALAEVKGINEGEVDRIVAARSEGQGYGSLTDFWHRAQVSRPIVERLVLAGGFDSLYDIGARRCPRAASATAAGSPGATCCSRSPSSTATPGPSTGRRAAACAVAGWPRPARSPRPPSAPPRPRAATAPTRRPATRRPARCPSGTPSPSRGSGRAPPPRPSRPRRRGRSTRSSSRSPWRRAGSPARPSPGCPR